MSPEQAARTLPAFVLAFALLPTLAAAAPADSDVLDPAALATDLLIVTDGSGHYLATSLTDRDRVFYGDDKTLWEQSVISSGADPTQGDYSWRLWSPQSANHADLALDDGKAWTVDCSSRSTPMHRLDEHDTRALLDKVQLRKPLWKRQSVALARDRRGRYFFVDRLRDDFGGKGLRLFIGKKGRLRETRLSDAVSDSAGMVLTSRAGVLSIDLEKSAARFGSGKRRVDLIFLPPQDNRVLIYGELGVYRERLGVPCDDL